MIRWNYAQALCRDPDATLDDLREAVTRFEDANLIFHGPRGACSAARTRSHWT